MRKCREFTGGSGLRVGTTKDSPLDICDYAEVDFIRWSGIFENGEKPFWTS